MLSHDLFFRDLKIWLFGSSLLHQGGEGKGRGGGEVSTLIMGFESSTYNVEGRVLTNVAAPQSLGVRNLKVQASALKT